MIRSYLVNNLARQFNALSDSLWIMLNGDDVLQRDLDMTVPG
jgi:hypothetical protein